MTKQNQTDPRKQFAPRILPWLLGAAMLLVYGLTLNRWVSVLNLGPVASLSGFVWQPQYFNPLAFLATYPIRWLPPAQIPLALNLFSAVCGAITLAMLARTVALLPQDHTEAQRQRERNDFSFLTGWPSWFPPVVAVALVGLQLTFWQHATSFTGEMFDLLLFAFIIWQLAEYRLDEQPWRLNTLTIVYGAALAENWAMLAFLPVFITAIIWLRKLEFFNARFLLRLALCGLAGMMFFLVLPLIAKTSATFPVGFWEALRPNLRMEWLVMKAIGDGGVRHNLALMSLTTLLPVLVMSIRWSASFGDSSHLGAGLARNMFHFIHAVILTVCVWVMFDPPFSPRQIGLGVPSLTLYYFAALSIGYYCGYFLLVFGKDAMPSRRQSKPEPILPDGLLWLCPVIVAGTLAAAMLAAGVLVYKNFPIIRQANGDVLLKFAQFTTQNLPRGGAILLSDSDRPGQNDPTRAFLIQAALVREGRAKDYPVVDTQALNWPQYHRYLHKTFPGKWPKLVGDKEVGAVNALMLYSLITDLSKSNTICYLNPSYGYYFEQFYPEPHGLTYRMKPLPADTLLAPPLAEKLIAENETVWSSVTDSASPAIEKALKIQKLLSAPEAQRPKNFADKLLAHLHIVTEPDPNALLVGTFYSRSLNDWGVALQRANQLDKAAVRFNTALLFNPDNVAAGINLDFNRSLRAGTAASVAVGRITADQFGKYRDWNQVLNACGPFDETSFCFQSGVLLTQGALLRQAIAAFARVRQLVPDNLATRLWLAQLYLYARLPDRAFEALHDPLTEPGRFSLTEKNSTELNLLTSAAYFQKDEIPQGVALLESELNRHPEDENLFTLASQAFMMRGLYTNALRVIDRKLALTPDDPKWLFGKGYAKIQIGAYNDAIAALTRVMEIQTNDPTARFNRALAYLDSDKLDLARADYAQLQTTYTNSFQVAFGLAEVAWRQRDTNAAIHNYQLYLATAPTNSVEFRIVHERIAQLQKK
jgi:tetratricopeptide (TPR) repeat protein